MRARSVIFPGSEGAHDPRMDFPSLPPSFPFVMFGDLAKMSEKDGRTTAGTLPSNPAIGHPNSGHKIGGGAT